MTISSISNRDPRWAGMMAEVERDEELDGNDGIEVVEGAAISSVVIAPKTTLADLGRMCEAWGVVAVVNSRKGKTTVRLMQYDIQDNKEG